MGKKQERMMIDPSRCLHNKNSRNMTIGDYLGITVGETYNNITRIGWNTWSTEGGVAQGLFESYGGKK